MELSSLKVKLNDLKEYLVSLGIAGEIKNEDLCITAFVHKSFSADYNNTLPHNERLEFLGDAVLGANIAKFLYIDNPKEAESKLSLYKIALVREWILAEVAREIGLGKMLWVSKWEEKNQGRNKDSILSDALEALIWYLSLDMGNQVAENFIRKYIYSHFDKIKLWPVKSNKTKLQELIQRKYKVIPEYKEKIDSENQKNNEITYKSEIFVLDEKKAEWFWTSKKKAQEHAAGVLLKEYKKKS